MMIVISRQLAVNRAWYSVVWRVFSAYVPNHLRQLSLPSLLGR